MRSSRTLPTFPASRSINWRQGSRTTSRAGLDGGPGGLAMVARLIEEAPDLLKPGGHLVLEIGSAQEEPVRALIESQPRLRAAPTIYDHAQHPRVIRATRIGDPV